MPVKLILKTALLIKKENNMAIICKLQGITFFKNKLKLTRWRTFALPKTEEQYQDFVGRFNNTRFNLFILLVAVFWSIQTLQTTSKEQLNDKSARIDAQITLIATANSTTDSILDTTTTVQCVKAY